MKREIHKTWGGSRIVGIGHWELRWRYFLRGFALGPDVRVHWRADWHYIEAACHFGLVTVVVCYSRFTPPMAVKR